VVEALGDKGGIAKLRRIEPSGAAAISRRFCSIDIYLAHHIIPLFQASSCIYNRDSALARLCCKSPNDGIMIGHRQPSRWTTSTWNNHLSRPCHFSLFFNPNIDLQHHHVSGISGTGSRRPHFRRQATRSEIILA